MIEFLSWAPIDMRRPGEVDKTKRAAKHAKLKARRQATPRKRYHVGGDRYLTIAELMAVTGYAEKGIRSRIHRLGEGRHLLDPKP